MSPAKCGLCSRTFKTKRGKKVHEAMHRRKQDQARAQHLNTIKAGGFINEPKPIDHEFADVAEEASLVDVEKVEEDAFEQEVAKRNDEIKARQDVTNIKCAIIHSIAGDNKLNAPNSYKIRLIQWVLDAEVTK